MPVEWAYHHAMTVIDRTDRLHFTGDEEADRLSVIAPVVRKPFDVDELVTAVRQNVGPEGPTPPPWL